MDVISRTVTAILHDTGVRPIFADENGGDEDAAVIRGQGARKYPTLFILPAQATLRTRLPYRGSLKASPEDQALSSRGELSPQNRLSGYRLKTVARQHQRYLCHLTSATTRVLAGVLAASVFGIFLIPMLYVVFQRLTERTSGRAPADNTAAAAADAT